LVTVDCYYLPPPPISSPSQREGEDLERSPSFTNASSYGDFSARGGGLERSPSLSSPSLWEGEEEGGGGSIFYFVTELIGSYS